MADYTEGHDHAGIVNKFPRIMLGLKDVSCLRDMASLLFPKPLAKAYLTRDTGKMS